MKAENTNTNLLYKLLVAIVLIWAISGVAVVYFIDSWQDRGTFGDLFGAINALFSGLAFAAILYTIHFQREEIRLNRDEITLNRKELAKSVKAQQDSQSALKQQVEQTHLSATMNAMNTLIEYYNNQIESTKSSEETIQKAREKRRAIIRKIDELIDGLENSENE
jgi:uncharacterized protein YqgV (UPF0045/DUF77 family)